MSYDLIEIVGIIFYLDLQFHFIIDDIFNKIIVQFYFFNQKFCSIS